MFRLAERMADGLSQLVKSGSCRTSLGRTCQWIRLQRWRVWRFLWEINGARAVTGADVTCPKLRTVAQVSANQQRVELGRTE